MAQQLLSAIKRRGRREATLQAGSVLFDDDFSDDIGWNPPRVGNTTTVGVLSKWDSYVLLTADYSVIDGAGINGGAALRISLDPKLSSTGIVETGRITASFEESTTAHIRTWLKVSEGFQFFGPGTSNTLWKFWRLQQSPWVRGLVPPQGVNGEENTGYYVASMNQTFGNGSGNIGNILSSSTCWRSNLLGSVNGAQLIYKWREYEHRIPWGDIDANGVCTNTEWVRIDVHCKLSDMDQDNGILKWWYNGVPVADFTVVLPAYGGQLPAGGNPQALTTNAFSHNGYPPGYNTFSFLDNYSGLTFNWRETRHYIYCDRVTIYDHLPSDLTL